MSDRFPEPIVLPRFLKEQNLPQFAYQEAREFSCVEYTHSEEQRENKFIISSSLFVMILAGEKIIHAPESDIHLHAGEAFFARKGSHVFSELLSSGGLYHAAIFFISDRYLEKFLCRHSGIDLPQQSERVPDVFQICTTDLLQLGFKSLLPYLRSSSPSVLDLVYLKLEELLLLALDANEEKVFHSFLHDLSSNKKQNILSVMEKYYRRSLTIQDFAALSGRSTSAFKRDFRTLFDESPGQWITKRRLKEALILLKYSEITVSDVCFTVGFKSLSHFSRIFKKCYGYSPAVVKKSRKR